MARRVEKLVHVKPKLVVSFETSDGKSFKSEAAADAHELAISFEKKNLTKGFMKGSTKLASSYTLYKIPLDILVSNISSFAKAYPGTILEISSGYYPGSFIQGYIPKEKSNNETD